MFKTRSKFWFLCASLVILVQLRTRTAQSQGYDPRDFYASHSDGTGINQWVRKNGYRTIFEFFQSNSGEAYHKRTIYIFDNDPNQKKYVYDENGGHVIGRWDEDGYSNLPVANQGKRLSQYRNSDFPPADPTPTLPYSRDNYPRNMPPPTRN